MISVDRGKEDLPGQWAALAPARMAEDRLAELTPGVPLLIRQVVPPERGVPKLRLRVALSGGAAFSRRDMLAFALAVPALERHYIGAASALWIGSYFHTVLSFPFAAGRADSLVAAACNASNVFQLDGGCIISLRQAQEVSAATTPGDGAHRITGRESRRKPAVGAPERLQQHVTSVAETGWQVKEKSGF